MDHGTLMRIGAAARDYYEEAKPLVKPEYLPMFLEAVSPSLQSLFKEKGYEHAKTALPFLRFVMEMNDKGMDLYMKGKLSDDDYESWMSTEKEIKYKEWREKWKKK